MKKTENSAHKKIIAPHTAVDRPIDFQTTVTI
jgi:hypothetical protein